MARTSKTKIGGGSGEQNDRMMRAASSGHAAVSQAHERLMAQERTNLQQGAQIGREIGGAMERHSARQEQTRQFDVQAKMQQERTDLEAAKAGFERRPEGQQGPAGDRATKLEEEMRRGAGQPAIGPLDAESQDRLNKQVNQGMELGGGGGTWQPSEERQKAQASEQRRADFRADTERMRAIAYKQQVGAQAQKALAAGNQEEYKALSKQLAQQPNSRQKQYDRLMNGDTNPNDWGELQKLAAGSEEVEPTLMADLKAKQMTPRVQAFMRAQVAIDSLQSIVLSKGATADLEIDWTNPKMVEFGQQRQRVTEYMRSNPVMGQLSFIRGTEDKMRFLNVLAAAQVLAGQSEAPAMPTPATMAQPGGEPAPPAAPMVEQTMGTARPGAPGAGAEAVTAAREGGASPLEALQAGQQAQPTAGQVDDSYLKNMKGFGPR